MPNTEYQGWENRFSTPQKKKKTSKPKYLHIKSFPQSPHDTKQEKASLGISFFPNNRPYSVITFLAYLLSS